MVIGGCPAGFPGVAFSNVASVISLPGHENPKLGKTLLPLGFIKDHAAAVWLHKIVLVCGGRRDGPVAWSGAQSEVANMDCFSLDLSQSEMTWEVAEVRPPYKVRDHTMTSLSDGSVVLIGGYTDSPSGVGGGTHRHETWILEAQEGTTQWKRGPNLRIGTVYHCTAFLSGSTVVVTGGRKWGASNELNTVDKIDFATGVLTSLPHMSRTRFWHGCTTISTDQGKAVIVVGDRQYNNGGSRTGEFLVVDGPNREWTPLPGLTPELRSYPTLVPVNNGKGVWLIGGYDEKEQQMGKNIDANNSEIYQLESVDSEWTTVPGKTYLNWHHYAAVYLDN